jgi:hypothetical protein
MEGSKKDAATAIQTLNDNEQTMEEPQTFANESVFLCSTIFVSNGLWVG